MSTRRQTRPFCGGSRLASAVAWRVALFAALVPGGVGRAATVEAKAPEIFHLAFSTSMFTEVNESDARASVKVWAQMVAKERSIAASAEALITKDPADMIRALRAGRADAVVLPVDEYAEVSRAVDFSHLFIATHSGKLTEQYIVLVHRDSTVQHLAQLQGRDLLLFDSPRACLAGPWLDTQLLRGGQPAAATLCRRLQTAAKISKVILPVFFRQTDACVATRRGFDTMCELNPQVGRQLRVIAESPPLVPALIAIRADYRPPSLEPLLATFRELHTSASGQLILTVFQSERLAEQPPELLAESLALLAEHARLTAAAPPSRNGDAR